MFRWLQAFVHRELVSDVPPEMELCLDCGKLPARNQSIARSA